MKKRMIALVATIGTLSSLLSGCVFKALEKEINVVFMNEGRIVASGTVTQFKNIQSPTISKSYIPNDYRFLGWTSYSVEELDYSSASNFKTQYIGGGRMVHYMDVVDFAENETVVLNALILHKDDIPKEYHYAVVAWYDKAGTSGLAQARMDEYKKMVDNYLIAEGVTEEDINSVVFRPYSGNVGPTTGQILYDDDVDIMFGWGSLNNITTTGSIPEEMVLESVEFPLVYNGETKNRYIHRLTDSVGSLKVMEYLKSEETHTFFNK